MNKTDLALIKEVVTVIVENASIKEESKQEFLHWLGNALIDIDTYKEVKYETYLVRDRRQRNNE